MRQLNFTCTDADISLPKDPAFPYPYFDYHAVASYGVVIGLSFGIPVIFVCNTTDDIVAEYIEGGGQADKLARE